MFRARLQFSSRLTKRDACPGTCTLSPLHAALTMRFTKNTHRDTSKVLRLEVSKVRACHEKCNSSSENDTKVLRLPHKTTFDTVWNTWECHKGATRATRNKYAMFGTSLEPPKVTTVAELAIGTAIRPSRGHLRTVANLWGRLRTVWRTQPQPPNLQCETGTLATYSGKIPPASEMT